MINYAKVINGIYIGDIHSINDNEFLINNDIKYIVNASGYNKLNNLGITTLYLGKLKDIDFITLPIFDKEYIDKYISEYINKMLISSNKINNEYRNKNNILVHCIAGINRSASDIATYLMMYQKYTYNDAIILLENVNKKRFLPVIANRAFRDMLKHIEKNLKFFDTVT